jgi:hypothetical protein
MRSYFHNPAVRANLTAATSRLGPLLAGSPAGRSVPVRNLLAFIARRATERAALVTAVNSMHGVVSPMPSRSGELPLSVAYAQRGCAPGRCDVLGGTDKIGMLIMCRSVTLSFLR